jgi:hypothetical protein
MMFGGPKPPIGLPPTSELRQHIQGFQPNAQGAPVPGQFNPYAAGDKHYGGGRSAPNVGKTTNKVGYGKRDAKKAAMTEAFKRHGGK